MFLGTLLAHFTPVRISRRSYQKSELTSGNQSAHEKEFQNEPKNLLDGFSIAYIVRLSRPPCIKIEEGTHAPPIAAGDAYSPSETHNEEDDLKYEHQQLDSIS